MGIQGASASRAQKIAAIAAAGVVLLGGATITSLAAWTDAEYVVGGVGNQPGIGTSLFEMEQNTVLDTEEADPTWVNRETQVNPGVIEFGPGALSLTPDTTVYAFVQLRTSLTTTVPGHVTLNGAVDNQADADVPELFDELTYGAVIVAQPTDCDATGYLTPVATLVAEGNALTVGSIPSAFDVLVSHAPVTVCFAVTLPADAPADIQGDTSEPVWRFSAISF